MSTSRSFSSSECEGAESLRDVGVMMDRWGNSKRLEKRKAQHLRSTTKGRCEQLRVRKPEGAKGMHDEYIKSTE